MIGLEITNHLLLHYMTKYLYCSYNLRASYYKPKQQPFCHLCFIAMWCNAKRKKENKEINKNSTSPVCIKQTLIVFLISSLSSVGDYARFSVFAAVFFLFLFFIYLIYAQRHTVEELLKKHHFNWNEQIKLKWVVLLHELPCKLTEVMKRAK